MTFSQLSLVVRLYRQAANAPDLTPEEFRLFVQMLPVERASADDLRRTIKMARQIGFLRAIRNASWAQVYVPRTADADFRRLREVKHGEDTEPPV